jgi:hypothetical protein
LEHWDERLGDLGGDPAREDWSRFRPLRLTREEDWSDWLAHLLEHSRSGRFSARFFTGSVREAARWRVDRAEREVVADEYRADLIVRFANGDWVHLEVKVGDRDLAKTLNTGDALQRYEPRKRLHDFLLLPEADMRASANKLSLRGALEEVEVRTWHDVARALRVSITETDLEPLVWRAWAAAFLGAVEQLLLDFPPVPRKAPGGRPSAGDLARLDFLEGVI